VPAVPAQVEDEGGGQLAKHTYIFNNKNIGAVVELHVMVK